jgi:hypothetical protein
MTREVPARARELAARLSALFVADSEIAERLNDAQRRLAGANDRLWLGLAPDTVGLIHDGAAASGESLIVRLVGGARHLGERDGRVAVLRAMQQVHRTIRRAFCDYQSACEERRRLAVDVGELSQQLVETLAAAGWPEDAARDADVHQLAAAGWR